VTAEVTISVALCTFNGERFLRQQLDSILAQSVLPTELILSDDGSTDSTGAILQSSIDAARGGAVRVTVLRNTTPIGTVANFQRAIEACTGDLIVLCDQDDVWRPDRLEWMLSQFDSRADLLLLHSDADLIDAEGAALPGSLFEALGVGSSTQRRVHAGGAWKVLLRRNIVTGATTALRRSLASVALPVPDGWLHDEWLAIVSAATGRMDLTSERLIGYRQHGNNQIGVQALDISGKIGRMLETGSARNARLLARAASLAARLPDLPGVSPAKIADAKAKLVHEQVRSRLGRRRLPRAGHVLRELWTGRYRRFGRGLADAARDLLQPLDPATSAGLTEGTVHD
jgi:glycosyltransferase involved in cell wall biosynthesis